MGDCNQVFIVSQVLVIINGVILLGQSMYLILALILHNCKSLTTIYQFQFLFIQLVFLIPCLIHDISRLTFGLFCASLGRLSGTFPLRQLVRLHASQVPGTFNRVLPLRRSIQCSPFQVLPLMGFGLPLPPQGFRLMNLVPVLPHFLFGLLCLKPLYKLVILVLVQVILV